MFRNDRYTIDRAGVTTDSGIYEVNVEEVDVFALGEFSDHQGQMTSRYIDTYSAAYVAILPRLFVVPLPSTP